MTTDIPLTIPAALERCAERFGDREALVDGDTRWTWSELANQVDRAAAALIVSGIAHGDRIGIWAPNISEWVVTALAIHSVGAVVIPVNTRYRGNEAAYILARAGARMLFTVTDFLDTNYVAMLRSADDGIPDSLNEIVVLRGSPAENTTDWSNFLERALSVTADDLRSRVMAVDTNDLCDILFTSGTTGAPKGAMLRHGATVRAYTAWSDVIGLREDDRYLVINPFFHAFGLKAGILASVLTGATIIPHAVFDVPSVVRRIQEERISMLPGPPAIYQTILNDPDLADKDLSTLRLAVTGAATIPVELIERMRSDLPFETVVTGYGLTEATGIATMCRHDDDPITIATTSGRPIPGMEMRLVDNDGNEVSVGEPGEVLLRGFNVMAGYLDDPQATAEAIDSDGWLHTGDVGVIDDNGNLRITDRIKDMFIVGGFNTYPAEIEQALARHPSISVAAVVGIPDERMGEVGCAFIIPRAGETIDPEEVIAWARERLANYKVPRRVIVVDQLPMNASGKVLKFELRDRVTRNEV